jgi:cysteine desulfurase / selenocysteine lyase
MSVIVSHREQKTGPPSSMIDARRDFPIFEQSIRGKELVYLDSGATTQKPHSVLEAMDRYYELKNANIHRGNYALSLEATTAFEQAREKVARFLNVKDTREIVFTRGTTESINLVASSLSRHLLKRGDEIIISTMEHHSNIVPWQLACEQYGAVLKVIPINDAGELLMDEFQKLLSPRTRIVAVTHLSNALGTINDVATIIKMAHAVGAVVLVDGAQWVAHHVTDLPTLDVDFYAFSGHKLYGPTGIGVLYGKRIWLERMPPYQGGGDMIKRVTFEKTTYADLPNKFEAGTPNIAGAIGLGAAIDYINHLGLAKIAQQEEALLKYLERRLQEVPGLRIIGTSPHKSGAVSFLLQEPAVAAYDVGLRLDVDGIAVRTGHHCCQPLMDRFGIGATIRATLGVYNRASDVDALIDSLQALRKERAAQPAATRPAAITLANDEPAYPEAFAETPEAAAEQLIDEFSFLDDWADRYQYIIDLGNKLPVFPEHERTEINRVHGCQSTVFLSARKRPGTLDTLDFLADSDADIVRGLIAILQRLFTGQKASAILAFDIEAFLEKIGLDKNLAMTRRNGLVSMIKRIKVMAQAIETSCVGCAKC